MFINFKLLKSAAKYTISTPNKNKSVAATYVVGIPNFLVIIY